MYRKLKKENLVVGEMFVAYAPNVAELAANGTKGVIVTCTKNDRTVKLKVPNGKEVSFKFTEQDAFIHRLSDKIEMIVRVPDTTVFPAFSERMHQEGVNGAQMLFNPENVYVEEDEDSEYKGMEFYFFDSPNIDPDTDEPFINNILLNNLMPLNEPQWIIPRAERMGMGVIELPLPVKPVAQEHEAVIQQVTELLGESVRTTNGNNNVSYKKLDKDFKVVDDCMSQACHRKLREFVSGVRWVVTQGKHHGEVGSWNKGLPSDDAMRFYITYLTSYSPYSDVFVTKDPEHILRYGYILDASQSAVLLVGAAYATRQVWERKGRIEAFYALYQQGIPLDMAFVFGASCSAWNDNGAKFSEAGASHSHLYTGRMTDECILSFISHKKFNDKPFAVNKSIASTDHMWGELAGKHCSALQEMAAIKTAGIPGKDMYDKETAIEMAADVVDAWRQEHGV